MPKQIDLTNVSITGGYLGAKQEMNRLVTVPATYRQFDKTGRVDSVKLKWREGDANKPHIFWDSDIAKWIEGAAYTLYSHRDGNLEALIDSIVADMKKNQDEDGYFNIYYQTCEPHNRFTNRGNHELYCAGHLLEGAIAYKNATGKRDMLDVMIKYIDYIEKEFKIKERPESFRTPGHEEIELALVKLYHETNDSRYLELSEYFVNARGKSEGEKQTFANWASAAYAQDHLPVAEQFTAEGHAVRCLYLFAGAADIARECGDEKLKTACEKLFDNIVNKKMYVTGGLGGNYAGEAFSCDYDLPNELAYTETCASIAMIFFVQRMYLLTGDKKYMDILELQFYNAVMSGISSHGDRFFYCNPLEVHPDRRDYFSSIRNNQFAPEYDRPEYFGCSCCPPNVIRLISSFGQYMYHYDGDKIYVNQFGSSKAEINGVTIEQTTDYPYDGKIRFTVTAKEKKDFEVYIRIPEWSKNFGIDTDLTDSLPYVVENGYIKIKLTALETFTDFKVMFLMLPEEVHANPKVHYAAGRIAVKRGPVVYCAESTDNGGCLKSALIKKNADYKVEKAVIGEDETVILKCGAEFAVCEDNAPLYQTEAFKSETKTLTLIPYALWANRGRSEMIVWIDTEK